jgi:hypothetical protein
MAETIWRAIPGHRRAISRRFPGQGASVNHITAAMPARPATPGEQSMTSALRTGRDVCADCGSVAEGRFCSNCGAELERQRHGFMRRAASNVGRFPLTLLRLVASPVSTTLALSQDPAYRGHVGFLAVSLALSAAISGGAAVSGALEQTSTEVAKVPELAGNAGLKWWLDFVAAYRKELLTFATYAVIAIHLLMNFVVLKAFRPRSNVTFTKYFKLFCVASGFYVFAWTIADAFNALAFRQDPSALSKAMISSGAWPALRDYLTSPPGLVVAATGLALLVCHVRVQTSFWGLSVPKVLASLPLVLIASALAVAALELAFLVAVGGLRA